MTLERAQYLKALIKYQTPHGIYCLTEIMFTRELTEQEIEDFNQLVLSDDAVIDWRDDQTLWVWDSKEALDAWLKSIDTNWSTNHDR